MPTIRDVAKLAGVSTATVSHVLNNSRTVLPETRQHVLAAIKRLNYRPSAIARSLSTNITRSIAVIVADITNPFFAAMVRGIEDRLEPQGYHLIVCNTDEQPDREARYLELFLTRRVDGVIIAPTGESQPLLREFASHHIPLVFIDRKPAHAFGSVIAADNIAAGYAATDHLLTLGHRRIAILVRAPSLSTVQGRLEGYRQAFRAHQVRVDPALVCVAENSPDGARATARRLLESSQRPTAIIPTNSMMTLGVLQALHELNLKYPDDVSLVVFDENPWLGLFTPPLTAIRQPIAEFCDAAVATLGEAMARARAKEQTNSRDILLKTELISRASCQRVSSQDG